MNVPVVLKPTVESTVIILVPAPTFPITFVLPGIVNVPCIKSTSLKPTNKLTLYYKFPSLVVNGSISETAPLVAKSVDFVTV